MVTNSDEQLDGVDADGMHKDIDVQEISSDEEELGEKDVTKNKVPTADIQYFFTKTSRIAGSKKDRATCNLCM